MGRFARQFEDLYRAIRRDIYAFCRVMNFEPTWQQMQLLDAVQLGCYEFDQGLRHGALQIAVRSGQGPGKTTCSSIIGLWRTLRAENAMTILTAPTMRQCNEVWLAETRRLLAKADQIMQKIVKVTKTKVIVAGSADWGVKTVTATKEENAQGFHEENMTIIMEEASGIPRKIVENFKGTASNPDCLILMIGNPNTRDCSFFDCFNSQKHEWVRLTFNAEETPASKWFDPERNRRLEREFGRDSDVYRVRVLGEFPHTDPNCVFSAEDLDACSGPGLVLLCSRMAGPEGMPTRAISLDFARYGGDENAVYRRSGNSIVEAWALSRTDPSVAVRKGFEMQRNAGWRDSDCVYVADSGGMGQGVMSQFYDAEKRIIEFGSNETPNDTTRFENKITEAWFYLRSLARQRQCYLPADRVLQQQLSTRQYYLNKKGKLVLESKDEYEKRGFDSPDRADAVVMNFAADLGYVSANIHEVSSSQEGYSAQFGQGMLS